MKKRLQTLTLAGFIAGFSCAQAQTSGYWRFEGTIDSTNTTAVDSSGNGYDLTLTSSTTADEQLTIGSDPNNRAADIPTTIPQTGANNEEAYFLSTFNGNSYFQTADQPEFGGNAFTIETYLRQRAGGFGVLASQGWDTGSSSDRRFRFGVNRFSNELILNLNPSNTSLSADFGSLDLDTTYYLAVSVNADPINGTTATFFRQDLTNGGSLQKQTVSDATITSLNDPTTDFFVGSETGGTNQVAGTMDEVRYSNTNLSQQELLATVPEPGSYGVVAAVLALGAAFMHRRRRG